MNFLERRKGELRRTPLPRTLLNRGNEEDRAALEGGVNRRVQLNGIVTLGLGLVYTADGRFSYMQTIFYTELARI